MNLKTFPKENQEDILCAIYTNLSHWVIDADDPASNYGEVCWGILSLYNLLGSKGEYCGRNVARWCEEYYDALRIQKYDNAEELNDPFVAKSCDEAKEYVEKFVALMSQEK